MKKIFTVILISYLLYLPILAIAQTNYKKATVITTQGDTLKGYIDQKEWIRNPQRFTYKPTLEAKEEQEFTTATSKYFELEGMDEYEHYEGRITTDITDLGKLNKFIDTSRVTATIFLKVVQKGKNVNLLSYRDEIKTRYFIQENKGATTEELIYRKYMNADNNRVGTSAIYRGQLLLAVQKYHDSPEKLRREIETANYTLPDILKIVHQINETTKKDSDLLYKKAPGVRFFTGIGINRSNIDVKGRNNLAENATYPYSYFPKLVVGADAFINPNVQRLILRGELSITSTNGKISKIDKGNYLTMEYLQTLKQNTFSISPQVIYNVYNGQKLKFYVGGGFMANISSYNNISYKRITALTSNGEVTSKSERENYVKLDNFWYSCPMRTGLVLNKKIDLSLIYFMPSTLTKYALYSYRTNVMQFQVNYLLNKK